MKKLVSILILIPWIAFSLPNIIIFNGDDFPAEYLQCYGSDGTWPMPNMEALAAAGVKFTRFEASRWCGPSRAATQSGTFDTVNNIFSPVIPNEAFFDPNLYTLADCLGEAGYVSGYVGKWNLRWGGENMSDPEGPEYEATQHQHIMDCGYDWVGQTSLGHTMLFGDPNVETNYMPYKVKESAVDFIETYGPGEAPFFLYYGFGLVHTCSNDDDPNQAGGGYVPLTPLNPSDDPATVGNSNLMYYATSYMDMMCGDVLDALTALGPETVSNTIVIVTGDNGGIAGVDTQINGVWVRGGKMSSRATATRVPFLVRWPAQITAGTTYSNLTGEVDILPTFAEMTGVSLPATSMARVHGRSFYKQLIGQSTKKTRDFYWHDNGKICGVDYLYRGTSGPGADNKVWCTTNWPAYDDIEMDPSSQFYKILFDRFTRYRDEIGDLGNTFTNITPWEGLSYEEIGVDIP